MADTLDSKRSRNMNAAGILFMAISVTSVLLLTSFCIGRVLTSK
jgi:hypothetical protein